MPTLRVVSVTASEVGDRHAVARLIEQHRPDVACVHGAPVFARWRSKSAALAREANLVVVGGGRTGGGTLLLSTLGVDVEALDEMTFDPPWTPRPRGGVAVAMRRLGAPFVIATGSDDDRARVLAAASSLVPDARPVVSCFAGRITSDAPIEVVERTEFGGGVRVDLTLPD